MSRASGPILVDCAGARDPDDVGGPPGRQRPDPREIRHPGRSTRPLDRTVATTGPVGA